jgi:hypothetical protein
MVVEFQDFTFWENDRSVIQRTKTRSQTHVNGTASEHRTVRLWVSTLKLRIYALTKSTSFKRSFLVESLIRSCPPSRPGTDTIQHRILANSSIFNAISVPMNEVPDCVLRKHRSQ